ncbi:MAG: hypothetical protein DMG01_21785 [Acidobacteria bacterium]|nr:MAG: hypothetical protein DMG01_21785 [Acidobacteriota bacterium]
MIRRLAIVEDLTGSLALLVMAVLPIAEIVSRRFFGRGIPASGPVVQHLTLWVGFLGAAIAAREGKLLALATGTFIPQGLWRRAADIVAAAFGACSAIVLAWGGWQMAAIEREAGTNIGAGIPTWIAQIVLPISFAIIAARLVWKAAFQASAALQGARPPPPKLAPRAKAEAFQASAPRRGSIAHSPRSASSPASSSSARLRSSKARRSRSASRS